MMQVSAQHSKGQTIKEGVDTTTQSVLFQQAGSGQLSPKSTKGTSKFASALEKFLELSGLKLYSKSNNSNRDLFTESGKTPQQSTGLLHSGGAGMVQLSNQHEVGVEGKPKNNVEAAGPISKNKKPGSKSALFKTATAEAQASGKSNQAGNAMVQEGKPVPVRTKQAAQTTISGLVKNGPLTTVQQADLTGNGIVNGNVNGNAQTGQRTGGEPGAKASLKSGSVNLLGIADKNGHLNVHLERRGMSVDKLEIFKNLALKQDAEPSKKSEGNIPQMAADSQSGTSQQSAKKKALFPSGSGKAGKNIQQIAGEAEKAFEVDQKTEKYTSKTERQAQISSDTGTQRTASTVLQRGTAHTSTQHNFDVRLGSVPANNASSTFKLTDTGNSHLDFNLDGGTGTGTGTEQLQTDSKGSQDIKLNTPFHQINSIAGRRSLSVQVAQTVQRGWSSQGQNMEQWQNHRFTFDDGNSLNVSVRQAEGGLQLQLGTSNTELSKLIQQNLNEINRLLQQQLNMNIDLEMQHFGSGEFGKSNDSDASASSADVVETETETETGPENRVGDISRKKMRYLGFNNKEWTA